MSPETATHVDGAKLVVWLEDLNLLDADRASVLGDRWERAIRAWKCEGRLAHVYTVDEFLCSIGLTLGMMPDDLWCEAPTRRPSLDADTVRRILRLRSLDWTVREVAAIIGVGQETVRRYSRKASAA